MKWEYKCEQCIVGPYYDELLEVWLKPAGKDGWEVIHITERRWPGDQVHLKAYFKRPVRDENGGK